MFVKNGGQLSEMSFMELVAFIPTVRSQMEVETNLTNQVIVNSFEELK